MNRDESFEDLRNTANCFVELEKANKKIKELEEENKKLNKLVQFNVKTTTTLTKKINKAIEYMEENIDGNKFETSDDVIILYNYVEDLIRILKGREND